MLIERDWPDGSIVIGGGGQIACRRCDIAFTPKRPNQSYCNPRCQKAASRNSTRGPRAGASDERDRNRRLFATLGWLNETYYGTPPRERLGLLMGWLNEARAGSAFLRRVLANPRFFAPADEDRRGVCFRRSREYPPVPFLADSLCKRLLDCRVWEWANGTAPEPETGETADPENPPSGIRSREL